jgi:hypothetical protein
MEISLIGCNEFYKKKLSLFKIFNKFLIIIRNAFVSLTLTEIIFELIFVPAAQTKIYKIKIFFLFKINCFLKEEKKI